MTTSGVPLLRAICPAPDVIHNLGWFVATLPPRVVPTSERHPLCRYTRPTCHGQRRHSRDFSPVSKLGTQATRLYAGKCCLHSASGCWQAIHEQSLEAVDEGSFRRAFAQARPCDAKTPPRALIRPVPRGTVEPAARRTIQGTGP